MDIATRDCECITSVIRDHRPITVIALVVLCGFCGGCSDAAPGVGSENAIELASATKNIKIVRQFRDQLPQFTHSLTLEGSNISPATNRFSWRFVAGINERYTLTMVVPVEIDKARNVKQDGECSFVLDKILSIEVDEDGKSVKSEVLRRFGEMDWKQVIAHGNLIQALDVDSTDVEKVEGFTHVFANNSVSSDARSNDDRGSSDPKDLNE